MLEDEKLAVLLLCHVDECCGGRALLRNTVVCKQWARLAPRACKSITLHLKSSSQALSFACWARKHGQHVEDLTITTLLAEALTTDAMREVHVSLAGLSSLASLALFGDCTDADVDHLCSHLPRSLTSLDLGLAETSITAAAVDSIAGLSSLLKLDLSHSCLGDAGLQLIAHKMPQLCDLRLNYCRPSITATGLHAVPGMASLTCLHCAVHSEEQPADRPTQGQEESGDEEGGVPAWQGAITDTAAVLELLPAGLQELNLRGHSVGAPGAAALARGPASASLTWLNLAACKLDDDAAAMLGSLAAIETMDLSRNAITMAGLQRALSPGLPLRSLDLSRNAIHDGLQQLMIVGQHHSHSDSSSEASAARSASLPESAADLPGASVAGTSAAASLKDATPSAGVADPRLPASAGSSEGGGSAFAALADTLEDLSLSNNVLKSRGIQALSPLQGLRQLNLSSCSITDAGLQGLSELQQLQQLNLSDNQAIMDAGALLGQLSRLTALKQLQLAGIGLQDSALAQVYMLLGNVQIAEVAARHPMVAEAAVLHLPICGVELAGTNLPETVLVLALNEPAATDVLVMAQQVLASSSAAAGAFASPPGAVVVLGGCFPRLDNSLALDMLLPEVVAALTQQA